MIELGCNYSLELMKLLNDERVKVDWVKLAKELRYKEQFKAVNSIRPILFHMVPRATSDKFSEGWNYDNLNKAIEECQSPHVASHLLASRDNYKEAITREILKEDVVEKLIHKKRNIKTALLIENMPQNYLPKGYEHFAEPEMIAEICDEAGVGLLLDLAHLKVSAWYRGESELEYLKRLPLHLVKEIHVSGPRKTDSGYYDVHQNMREEDFEFLESVLSLTNPCIVTLEYGGEGEDYKDSSDIKLLQSQLTRLARLLEMK